MPEEEYRPPTPITLETAGLKTYGELYELSTAEAIKRRDERHFELHPGDAFLAVVGAARGG